MVEQAHPSRRRRVGLLLALMMIAAILAPAATLAGGCDNTCPPPPPPAGCTPGYWKQPQHFDSWPSALTPSTLFASVVVNDQNSVAHQFENAYPGKTLLQVLWTGGGGMSALGRHTVAALLNAYQLPGSVYGGVSVIDMFNAANPNGDIEGTKDLFADANEIGCPLN